MSNDTHPIFGCFFDRETDTRVRDGKRFDIEGNEGEWSELCDVLSKHEVRSNKFGGKDKTGLAEDIMAPMFNLARYRDRDGKPACRQNWHVVALSGIVFDLDENVDIDRIQQELREIEFCAYTTHSHDPIAGLHKWRIVFPLTRAVTAAAYKSARAWIVTSHPKAGLLVDAKAAALSTAYFLPSCPEETQHAARAFRNEGMLLELPAMHELTKAASFPAPRQFTKTVDQTWLRAKLLSYKDEHLRVAFKSVLKGQAFGSAPTATTPGNRNDTLSRMAGVLAGWYPYANADELAAIFFESLKVMTAQEPNDPPPDVDWVADNIERAQSKILSRAADEQVTFDFAAGIAPEKKDLAERQKEREAANAELAEVTPTQREELDLVAQDLGLVDAGTFHKSLILSFHKNFWCWAPEQHTWNGPWQDSEIFRIMHQQLNGIPGVMLYKLTEHGLSKKQATDLLIEYGRVIENISYDLRVDRTTYEPADSRLRINIPRRPLVAERAPPAVEDWLNEFGGDYASKLTDWLSTMLRFDLPQSGLFILGAKNTGKSLFCRAISQIWKVESPTRPQHALSTFNGEIVKCPIVWIDEGRWDNSRDPTLMLRQIITENDRKINDKHASLVMHEGYLRIVASVNNFKMFTQQESLTPEDRDAIASRFLHITPRPKAAEILRKMGTFDARNAIVKKSILAKHILWLQQTHAPSVEIGDRFAVEGQVEGSFAERLITDDEGWGSRVTAWLVGWLTDPMRVERENMQKVFRKLGMCIINPALVIAQWGTFIKSGFPEHQQIINALRALSHEGHPVEFPEPNPHGMCGYRIKTDLIVDWAQRSAYPVAPILRSVSGATLHAVTPSNESPSQSVLS